MSDLSDRSDWSDWSDDTRSATADDTPCKGEQPLSNLRVRLMCAWTFVVVSAACAAAEQTDAGPGGGAARLPHQTFYASFDHGLAADYAVGLAQPLAHGYALTEAPGQPGKALRYDGRRPRHARVFYDAPGNLHPARGTCLLRFRPDSDEDGRPYCRPVLLGLSTAVEGYWGCVMMWGPRMMSGKTPMARCYASVFEGSHGLHKTSYRIEGRWRKGEWRRLALVWDSRLGIKMYDNGELVASKWGVEHGWAEVPDCPGRQVSFGMFNPGFRGGGRPGYAIDEVRIFAAALSAETIAALSEDRLDAPVRLEPIPEEATQRTLTRMGWAGASRQELAPLLVGRGDPAPTTIRVNAIDESVDARRPLSHLSDGLPSSGWRHPTYGASTSAREVDLKLREPGRFNRIEIDVFRKFAGRFVPASPEDAAPPLPAVAVPEDRMAWRASLAKPFAARTLRLQREEGRAAEVRLWEVGRPEVELLQGTRPEAFVSVAPLTAETLDRCLAGRAARQSLPGSPVGWRIAREAPGQQHEPLRCQPLTPVFLMSDGILEDLAAGAVTLRLDFAEAQPGAVARLELRDPIWPTRRLFQGDFRIKGGREGQAAATVDLPDFFIAARASGEPFPEKGREVSAWLARQPLRLLAAFTFSHPVVLNAASLTVHASERDRAIAEHDRTQLPYIREGYADTSEARAYGWHPLAYEKLFHPLHDFDLREPERPETRAIAARVGLRKEPLKPALPALDPGVPRWASLQIELLKRCRALCHYWIEERELPNGEVGGGLGDDTDFKDDWVNLALISDDDGRIAASVRRLADTAWTRDGMDRGFQLWWRDALHAVEEGASLQPHLIHLYPGDPIGIERSMQMCGHLEDWMGETPTGKLHFKSWFVGGKARIRTDFSYGEDRPFCGLFTIMPAQYVWYSRHPAVAERLVRWCDSWLSYLDDKDENGKPLGLPSAVRWETGEVIGKRLDLAGGGAVPTYMLPAFVCAHHYTGDQRYLILHRLAARGLARTKRPSPGAWVPELARLGNDEDRALISDALLKLAYRSLDEVPSVSRDPSYTRSQLIPQHLAWRLTSDKAYLEVGLACALAFLDEQAPALTWALPSTDRIPQPRETLDRMYLGGLATLRPGYGAPYPEHAVSYRGLGESVAALVTRNRPDCVAITFFNTDAAPREIAVRFWQIRDGRYGLLEGPDANDDDGIDLARPPCRELRLQRGQPVRLTLPPRQRHVAKLALTEALPPAGPRPDLAVSSREVETDGNAGHATVVVHNVGLAAADNVLVRLVDARTGAAMDEKRIPRLEAPLDLAPRALRLQFFNVDTAPHGRVRILVDPDNGIAESDEHNNTAEFAF